MPGDPFYSSAVWREARAAYLRVHPLCEVAGCGRVARHVDHRKSRRAGGAPLDPANFMGLCHSCHSRKTARTDGGFGNRRGSSEPLRAVGCDASGRPLDPTHPWYRAAASPALAPRPAPAVAAISGGRGSESLAVEAPEAGSSPISVKPGEFSK